MYFYKAAPCTANVYRLVGKDEDALTYALGHLIAIDDDFMLGVLKEVGALEKVPGKRYRAYREDYKVYLQERREVGSSGRRDIVVEAGGAGGLRVVIEAKIGRGEPSVCQLLRYTVGCDCGKHREEATEGIRQTWVGPKKKFLVPLTRDALAPGVIRTVCRKLNGSGIEFRSARWHQILQVALRRRRQLRGYSAQLLFLSEFVRFFREHYEMNAFQAEVMVKKVDPLNAKIYFDGYMYVGGPRDVGLPLYFAPYFTNRCVGDVPQVRSAGISCVSRVTRTYSFRNADLKNTPESAADVEIRAHRNWPQWQWGLQEISRRAKREDWPDGDEDEARLYFLSKPAELNRTIKGPPQIPPGFSTTVFDLLTEDRLLKERGS
jgi:hypothetical protein